MVKKIVEDLVAANLKGKKDFVRANLNASLDNNH